MEHRPPRQLAHRAPFSLSNPNLKPSLPIEIPARRKPDPPTAHSPYARSASPDLIFYMSPISPPASPSAAHHSTLWSNSPDALIPPLRGRFALAPLSPL